MSGREPAWRLAIAELLETTEEVPAGNDRTAGYLLTPLGARVNRCLIAGTVTPAESRSGPDGTPFLRARLTDPTGSIDLSAGRFHPRAMTELRSIEIAGPAIVVGKPNRFATRDGRTLLSIRVESLRSCTPAQARDSEEAAADHLDSRLRLRERLLASPGAPDPALADGVPLRWVSAQREAILRYPSVETGRFRSVVDLLRNLGPVAPSVRPASEPGEPPVRVLRRDPPPVPPSRPALPLEAELLLSTVEQLSERSEDGYADLESVARRAAAQGIPEERSTELLRRLEGEGILEEPLQGKLRRAA